MIGAVRDRLTVIGTGRHPGIRSVVLLCICSCGVEKAIRKGDFVSGSTRSCGCWTSQRVAAMNTKHGEAIRASGPSTEWVTWRSMHQRCSDPRHKSFARYGGRGIRVCREWSTFAPFLADMGRRPPDLTLERIDNNLGYSKENCMWADRSTQAKNRAARDRLADGTFAPGVSNG